MRDSGLLKTKPPETWDRRRTGQWSTNHNIPPRTSWDQTRRKDPSEEPKSQRLSEILSGRGSTWNGDFLSFCDPFLVFLFLVPFLWLYVVFVFFIYSYRFLVCLYFRFPRNIFRYSSVSQIPVSYPIPEQYVMIHHHMSPSLDTYVLTRPYPNSTPTIET